MVGTVPPRTLLGRRRQTETVTRRNVAGIAVRSSLWLIRGGEEGFQLAL
jgi:hypothetical protein